MKIRELYVLDSIYDNIEVIDCKDANDFKKMIEDAKIISFIWKDTCINVNSTYIVSYVI